MTKNITFTADEGLIRKARARAMRENTSLNLEFRIWLKNYAEQPSRVSDFEALMRKLSYVQPGKKITREELNDR